MLKSKKLFKFILIVISFLTIVLNAEEGQYPLSSINKLDLKKAGLLIDQNEIYNPNEISLIDALVKVNGCTGSFVSPDGLIITNHHCAFGAVNEASTPEHNYLENGFLAKSRDKEIHAKDYKVKITESYDMKMFPTLSLKQLKVLMILKSARRSFQRKCGRLVKRQKIKKTQ